MHERCRTGTYLASVAVSTGCSDSTAKSCCPPYQLCNLRDAGNPSKPLNVHILPGIATLTVNWVRPADDTASSYTVRIYKDAGASSFAAEPAKVYPGLPWSGESYGGPGTLSLITDTYTFVLPADHGLSNGEVAKADALHMT